MEQVHKSAFTGDLAFLPAIIADEDLGVEIKSGKRIELAPSHFAESDRIMSLRKTSDPRVMHLVAGGSFRAVHTRPNDTHAPVILDGSGIVKIIRQREQGPEGYRTVED